MKPQNSDIHEFMDKIEFYEYSPKVDTIVSQRFKTLKI